MDKQLLCKIKDSKESPLIAVIGASNPKENYEKKMGIEVGYYLKEFFRSKGGYIFTGGVDGVGVDVYTGVMKYCIDKTNNSINDNFFILIPHYFEISDSNHNFLIQETYEPPSAYESLGMLSKKGQLDKIIIGIDMEERRKYLAMIADIIVVVNGGHGTIHEAVEGLKNNKPVINLFNTGGATKILKDFDEGRKVDLQGIIKKDELNSYKNNLHQAKDVNEMINLIKYLS